MINNKTKTEIISLFQQKDSIRSRNRICELLYPLIVEYARTYKRNSNIDFNLDDAINSTALILLNDFTKYNDVESFLSHVFGYLKYYKFNYNHPWLLSGDLPINILERKVLEFNLNYRCKYNKVKSDSNLKRLMAPLDNDSRTVVEMFLIGNYSKAEIAAKLGIDTNKVKKIYSRALIILRMAHIN